MKKIFFISILITLSLYARENPFAPQKSILDKQQIITTPTITLKQKEQLKLQELKNIKSPPPKKETIKKIVIKPIKKDSIKVKKTKITKRRAIKVKKKSKKIVHHKKKHYSKLIYNGIFAKIRVIGNSIKIITKDNLIKDFILKKPNRLVIDLERFDVVKPYVKKLYGTKIKKIKVGFHGYFYRVIFQLDKLHKYKLIKTSYGYIIKLY